MDALSTSLHDTAASPTYSQQLATFGRFIGSWDLEWQRISEGQVVDTAQGELHFGWVLGGRAVQDVWIVPSSGQPGDGQTPHAFHGSTIRFYDESRDVWRSTWVEPLNNRVRKFTGHEHDDEIELISLDDDPPLRWRFTEIKQSSFIWLGEYSSDETGHWILEERMIATRRK